MCLTFFINTFGFMKNTRIYGHSFIEIRNKHAQNYMSQFLEECQSCKASSTPPNRRVSMSPLNGELIEIICLDHFLPENVTEFLMMDVASRCVAGSVDTSTSMESVI